MLNTLPVSPFRASCTWKASAAWRKARQSSLPSKSHQRAWSRSVLQDQVASTVWAVKGDQKARRSRSDVQREIGKQRWAGKEQKTFKCLLLVKWVVWNISASRKLWKLVQHIIILIASVRVCLMAQILFCLSATLDANSPKWRYFYLALEVWEFSKAVKKHLEIHGLHWTATDYVPLH